MSKKQAPELKVENIRIDALRPYAKNPRRHNQKQIAMIARSIQEFGFRVPVLVDDQNVIVAGHGRYEAALAAGLDVIPCLRVSDLSEEAIRRYRIADNRIAELSEWDDDLLRAELDAIATDIDPEVIGYTAEELAAILGVEDLEDDERVPPAFRGSSEEPRERPATLVLEFPSGTWPLVRDEVTEKVGRLIERWGGVVR